MEADRAAVEEVALQHAAHDLHGLGAAGTDQPEEAVICPAKTEKEVLRTTVPMERFLDAQHLLAIVARLALLPVAGIELAGQAAPDHGLDDAIAVEVLGQVAGSDLAVAQHGDPVGKLQGLFQRVADEDDRDAVALQPSHQVEEVELLLRREGRGRLVEDHQPRLVVHRAGDLHHLLLAGTEGRNQGHRIDIEVERQQEPLGLDVEGRATG